MGSAKGNEERGTRQRGTNGPEAAEPWARVQVQSCTSKMRLRPIVDQKKSNVEEGASRETQRQTQKWQHDGYRTQTLTAWMCSSLGLADSTVLTTTKETETKQDSRFILDGLREESGCARKPKSSCAVAEAKPERETKSCTQSQSQAHLKEERAYLVSRLLRYLARLSKQE